MGFKSTVSEGSPFTLQNIPFGVFSTEQDPTPRCATAIGDFALDLRNLSKSGLFKDSSVTEALAQVRISRAQSLSTRISGQLICRASQPC